jgi:hypothetical protein
MKKSKTSDNTIVLAIYFPIGTSYIAKSQSSLMILVACFSVMDNMLGLYL